MPTRTPANIPKLRDTRQAWAVEYTQTDGKRVRISKLQDGTELNAIADLHERRRVGLRLCEEIRARIPGFLADIQANSDTLDLWQKLNYEGSPMRESIQVEAQKQFHSNKDSWSPMQETQLWKIGWPQ